jgi:hypothetical protein
VDVETCVAPAENFLHQRKADELFPEQQGEDLMGEDFLDHRTEISTLLLELILILSQKPLEIMKEYPIKNRMFRMTFVVDPCHGREDDSRNGPDCGKRPCSPDVPGMIESANLLKNVDKR